MKKIYKVSSLLIVILVIVAAIGLSIAAPAKAAVGFHISGRSLIDANGNTFLMRGISHAYVWYTGNNAAFADIKAKGANTIRVVLGDGHQWGPTSASEVTTIINLCKTNKLVCVLEVHDTTGYGEASAADTLANAVNYWKSIQSVLTGQENYVIINIGNEPYGNNNTTNWIADTKNAIIAMRSAGFQHTLMVDAPNWGQDWQFVMRDNAASVFAADTAKNTIFSIHMYSVFNTTSTVTSYIDTFKTNNLPLVVGEFGISLAGSAVDYADIMSYTKSNSVGWMAWSWSGNGSSDAALDMVNGFNASSPTTWGNIVFTGANGLSSTSVQCSVYSGTVATPTFTRTPTTGPSPTRTKTPTVGPSLTPTRTPTAGGPTATPGGACSPVTSTITAPFTYDGSGAFCWQSTNLGSYVNSWNLVSLSINGVSETNLYVAAGSYPAKINGNWYVSYNSTVSYGHFEAK
ncbi:MAG: cellulase family glycosylhydrolase [Anaerolineales bacterium]